MLKKFLISWIVGTVSIAIIGYCLVFAVGLVAAIAEWDSFVIGLGPFEFIEHTKHDSGGWAIGGSGGIFPLALLGGLLNGLVVAYFGSRSRS